MCTASLPLINVLRTVVMYRSHSESPTQDNSAPFAAAAAAAAIADAAAAAVAAAAAAVAVAAAAVDVRWLLSVSLQKLM